MTKALDIVQKPMNNGMGFVGMSTALHFLVDGLCVCCLYLLTYPSGMSEVVSVFILYNVLAFLTQPLTGWCMDRLDRASSGIHWMLLGSMLLMTLAVLTASLTTFLMPSRAALAMIAVMLGLGNSMFHVWGGQQVAVRTDNDIRWLGVFVSAGAFGLAVGLVLSSWMVLYVFLLAYCGLAVATLNIKNERLKSKFTGGENQGTGVVSARKPLYLVVLFLVIILLVVAFRSTLSTAFTINMKKPASVFLLVGLVSMLGKMAGGFLCKWLGIIAASILMVAGVVACCWLLSDTLMTNASLPLPLLGLFLVSCTMPVTLYLANVLLRGHEGVSFGLLAAALMPGYLLGVGFWVLDVDCWSGGSYYLTYLVPTILIELGVLWLLRERSKAVLWSSVAVNVFTNVLLNYLVRAGWIEGFTTFLLAELVVVLVESLWYACFVRDMKKAFIYGALCNAISFLTGLLCQMTYEMFIS